MKVESGSFSYEVKQVHVKVCGSTPMENMSLHMQITNRTSRSELFHTIVLHAHGLKFRMSRVLGLWSNYIIERFNKIENVLIFYYTLR